MTEGMKTSELWLAIAIIAAACLLAMFGQVEGAEALYAITGVGAAYKISRGIAKHGNGGPK